MRIKGELSLRRYTEYVWLLAATSCLDSLEMFSVSESIGN